MDLGTELGGRFRLLERVGHGAMGVVFRAEDAEASAPAAVKVVPLEVPGVKERFVREIRALATLEDPHVVRYLAHGVEGAEAWLAMEWLDGRDLQARLALGRLDVEDAVALAVRVGRALGQAHARGLVHRDVKPGNLFLPADDPARVKVLDFGVVQLTDASRLTQTGTVLGTPAFMAPEQASARPVDARADVYGVAGVLFACLTGRPPFVGKNPLALLARTVFEVPPRLDALVPELPAPLADLVEASLAKDPATRPADGHVFAERLAALDLGAAPAGRAPVGFVSTAEIRLVSVVVVQRPAGEDPEAERATVEAVAAPVGGRVARLVDGSWVLFVVGRESATDFGVFSARAALALRRLFWGAPIALATGRVRLDGPEPHGEAVEQAVALLDRARGDAVVTDTLTAELAQEAFRFEEVGEARLLLAPRNHAAPVLGRRTRLVGRKRELARVSGLWAHAVDEAHAQALLFTGVPGLGKSRLLRSAVDALRDDTAAVLSAGQGSLQHGAAFSLVGALLAGAAELDAREPITVRRRRLSSYLEGRLGPAAARAVAEALGGVAGAPARQRSPEDPRLAAEQARRAAERWLAAERARGPLLCAVDDAQWADRPSLEALAASLGGPGGAVLLLFAGRPAAASVVAAGLGEVTLEHAPLEPLGDKSAARLVREIAGEEASVAAVEAAVRAGAGNPYYLEELARAVAGADAAVTLPEEGVSTGSLSSVPSTVQAMAEARLEALQADLRRVLRAASVLGARFSPEGLAALLGDVDGPRLLAQLEQLVSRELLDAEGRGASYRFRHDLLRDAAYAQLTAEDRRAGHRRAADWLAGQDRPEAAVVAQHMRLAGLGAPAARWFSRAAELAFAAGDLEAARRHAEAGLAQALEPSELQVDLLRVEAEVRLWAGEVPAAAARAARAREVSSARGRAWLQAVAVHFQAAGRAGALDVVRGGLEEVRACEPPEAARVAHRLALAHGARELLRAGAAKEARSVLVTLDDADLGPLARAEIESVRAFAAMHAGDHEAWRMHLHAALRASESAGHVSQACALRGELGFASAQLGDLDVAWGQLCAAHREAAELHLTHVEQWVLSLLPPVAMERGQAKMALELAERAVQALVPLEDARLEGCARAYLARALAGRDALPRAEREAARAAEQLEPFLPLSGFAWAVRSEVALVAGRPEDALAHAERATALRREAGKLEEGDAAVPLALSRALAAVGRVDEAQTVAQEALQEIEAEARRIRAPTLRHAFLTRLSTHRALTDLAGPGAQ